MSPTQVLQKKEPINNSFTIAFYFFTKWHYVLPEDGTHVTKDVGKVHLMFVLINNVHLVGK